ncbi:MAG: hypothetical protein ACRDRP_13135 [Pseudonocardiaceae bacterium]
MNSRKLAGASAASVGAATAVVALLLGTLSANAGGDPRASAFGIAVEGLIPIAPTPYVEAPPDGSKALLEVPGPKRDGIYIALLKVEAEPFRSKATAVDVDVLGIRAKLIEASCDHGRGDSAIIGGTNDKGKFVPSSPASGQTLDLSPVLSIEFNRQYRDRDTLTVDALVVALLPGGNKGQAVADKDLVDLKSLAPNLKVPTMQELKAENPSKPVPTVGDLTTKIQSLNPGLAPKIGSDALLEIVVSSATCSDEREEKEEFAPPKEAPAPEPVEADLPVTH